MTTIPNSTNIKDPIPKARAVLPALLKRASRVCAIAMIDIDLKLSAQRSSGERYLSRIERNEYAVMPSLDSN